MVGYQSTSCTPAMGKHRDKEVIDFVQSQKRVDCRTCLLVAAKSSQDIEIIARTSMANNKALLGSVFRGGRSG